MKYLFVPLIMSALASAATLHRSFLQAPVASLEPTTAADTNTQLIINNAFDGLVSWDAVDGLVPQLAIRWDITNNGRTYEFELRQNVRFQDGTLVTAEAVRDSLEYLIKQPSYFRDHYQMIRRVDVTEDFRIAIELKRKYPDLLLLLSGVGAKIVKRSKGQVIGAGPFVPQLRKDGVSLIRKTDYWGALPAVQEIRFDLMPEQLAIERAKNNQIDDISLIALSDNSIPHNHGRTKVQPMWATWAVGLDQRVAPLDQLDVRREIIHRLTSESFVRQIYPDQEEAMGLIPIGIRGFSENKSSIIPVRRPLRKVGVEIFVPSFLVKVSEIQDWISKCFQGSWVRVKAVPKPFDWMIANYAKGVMGAYLLSFNAEFPDPSFLVRALTSTSRSNFLGIRSQRLDLLISSIEREENGRVKAILTERVSELLKENAASANLMHVRHRVWTRDCVSGLRLNPVSEGYTSYRKIVNQCP